MDYFTGLLATVLDVDRVNYIAVYGRVRQLSECIKQYLNLCSEDKQSFYRFDMGSSHFGME